MEDMNKILETPEKDMMVDLIRKADDLCITHFGNYQRLMKEFNKYAGLHMTPEISKGVREILHKIQVEFNVIYPLLHWVNWRAVNSKKITDEYFDFMKQIQSVDDQLLANNPFDIAQPMES